MPFSQSESLSDSYSHLGQLLTGLLQYTQHGAAFEDYSEATIGSKYSNWRNKAYLSAYTCVIVAIEVVLVAIWPPGAIQSAGYYL